MSNARSVIASLLADALWGIATLCLFGFLLTVISYEAPTSLDLLRVHHVVLVCAAVCLVVAAAVAFDCALDCARESAQRWRARRQRNKGPRAL